MWKDVKAILLPTNEKAKIWQHYKTKHLQLSQEDTKYHLTDNLFGNHLYIISLDEEIKEGDWCINDNHDTLYQPNCLGDTSGWNKIIATTDKVLTCQDDEYTLTKNLPQIPQQFIEEYISEYNKGNVIEDVEVEYTHTLINNTRFEDGIPVPNNFLIEVLKISKDNFISLRRKETKLYTREEVRQLINSFGDYHSINWLSPLTKDWLKHNNL